MPAECQLSRRLNQAAGVERDHDRRHIGVPALDQQAQDEVRHHRQADACVLLMTWRAVRSPLAQPPTPVSSARSAIDLVQLTQEGIGGLLCEVDTSLVDATQP